MFGRLTLESIWGKIKASNSSEEMMRGKKENQIVMLSAITPDQLVPQDHPIRKIKPIVDRALEELSPIFDRM